jgi:FkbM family methyltransferase
MKERLFHFFGNIFEQSPIPTPIKLAIAFRLDLFLFLLTQMTFRVLKTPGEARISEDFMKYMYINHIDENSDKIELLKKGLDKRSKDIIDNVIKRQKHIYTHNTLDLRLLTQEERKDQYINIYPIKRKYKGFGNYYGIENFYFHCGLRFLSKQFLKKYEKKDIIDAGAANGDTPAIFSREYSFNKIYAFEPENDNYKQLVKNIERFNLKNVIPINKGLGDKKSTLKITNDSGQSYISTKGGQAVDIITIDQFVEKNNISVGLIKMDIEGFESYALKGAQKTIKKYHPILLISIYHSGKDFFEIKPQLEKIGGYKFIVRKLNPHHFFFDTMLIGSPLL